LIAAADGLNDPIIVELLLQDCMVSMTSNRVVSGHVFWLGLLTTCAISLSGSGLIAKRS